ncbi:MAG TPA: LuxR C-terminal-related transcriptional regulator [Cellvibrio sp.]
MAAYDTESLAIDERESKVKSLVSSPQDINLYLGLTQTDVESLMKVVSQLQSINNAESQLIGSISKHLEEMLAIGGSALGIYYPANRENQIITSSINLEFIPNFGTYPCPMNGVLSSDSEHGRYVIFFDSQGASFYTYLCLHIGVQDLQDRQKQIINFILPYLFSCMKRLHLISCRLTEYGLTSREQEVVKWIIEGKDNWSISRILNVSERTVKFHNCNIYKKLGVSAKAEVICEYHKLLTSIHVSTNTAIKLGVG